MTHTEVAFITGAASGIGSCAALRLARRGASLGLFDVDAQGLESVSEHVRELGVDMVATTGDVADGERVGAAIAEIEQRLGTLTTAVCCAGVEVVGRVDDLRDEDWRRSLDVNLSGPFNVARHALPGLLCTRGSFCAVSSDSGFAAAPALAAYTAAKHGVIGLVRSMAIDHGPAGVRSNVVCPGSIRTPMLERLVATDEQADLDYWRSTIPLGRFGQAAEVAEAIAHLTSAEATYVNGAVYVVDGGCSAGYFGGEAS
jgi:meso-butanediol dehydrogenase/(S,S)-butanediol dehydrogenase/diacetyl reductase